MIKESELRIGNWVYINGIAVQLNRKTLSTILDKDGEITRCAGISLTPEILKKFGFEFLLLTDYPGWYSKEVNGSRIRIYEEGVGAFVYSASITHSVNIMNLHQLQNLYFALTGEELSIELNKQQ